MEIGDKMLKKLRLDQTQKYEKHLALEQIANMLVSFVTGQSYYLAIGAEQGDIEKWDDLVIESHNNSYIYIQAKRQFSDFSSEPIIRDTYRKDKREGQLRDLSPFDEAIRSIGKYVEKNPTDLNNEFWVEVPETSIQIKKGLKIRNLKELCEIYIKSVTTPSDLEHLRTKDSNVENIYNWLKTWCNFKDSTQILNALKILKIKISGSEDEIKERVNEKLKQIFKFEEIGKIYSLILSYLDENSTYAGAIKPRELLYLLKDYILPTIARWTLFKNNDSYWNVSGISDLESNSEVERPETVASTLWSPENENVRYLKIDGQCEENCAISESLIRLALHPQGPFNVICSDKSNWEYSIRSKVGGTIGVGKSDLEDLRILNGLTPIQQGECRTLSTLSENEKYAEVLQNEMCKITFRLMTRKIIEMIREMKRGTLRDAIEMCWGIWKNELESNVEEQKKICSEILHPKAEGESIIGQLRVGPKTVDLLSETMFLLLIVSVCLCDDSDLSWKTIRDKLHITAIGLAYWSGPADAKHKIIEIDDDDGMDKLIDNESGEIIIMSQSRLSQEEIINNDIIDRNSESELLTSTSHPKLIITNNILLKRKIRSGDLSEVREYFKVSLEKYKSRMKLAIDEVVK